MIKLSPVDDVRHFVSKADYLVHLSDGEAFCFSISEALEMGTPCITMDIPVLRELGFEDGKHGYIIPKDLNFDCNKLLDVPKIKPGRLAADKELVEQWKSLLGNTTPTKDYDPNELIMVEVTTEYLDLELNRILPQGSRHEMMKDRAQHLVDMNLVKVV